MTPSRRIAPTVALCLTALAPAAAIAGCGSSDNSSSASSSGGGGKKSSAAQGGVYSKPKTSAQPARSAKGSTASLQADPGGALKFNTKQLSAKAGTVTIVMKNMSQVPHGIAVEGNGVDKDGPTVTSGTSKVTLKLKPGKYSFYCPVDGHEKAGMKGTLTVQ